MKSFTDTAGRSWTIAINVDAIKRVRSLTQVDLLSVVEGTLIDQLGRDPILLVDVIYAACKPQADQQSVTAEQFGQAMAGDAIDGATQALLTELVDFFPKARRAPLAAVLGKSQAATTLLMQRATAKVEAISVEELIDKVMNGSPQQAGPTPNYGASPAPAGVQPAPTPGAS